LETNQTKILFTEWIDYPCEFVNRTMNVSLRSVFNQSDSAKPKD